MSKQLSLLKSEKRKRTAFRHGVPLGLLAAGATMAVAGFPTPAWSDNPAPPETHNDDILMGGNQNYGASGMGSAFWFSDSATNPTRFGAWITSVHEMIPNITGPTGMGNLYFNLGSNVVTVTSGSPPVARSVLKSATLKADYVTPGLIVEKFSLAAFSSNASETALGNVFDYPFSNSFHQHFNCRAFRPGSYVFSFHLTSVVARDGSALSDSPVYSLMLRCLPVLSGKVTYTGWQGVDTTEYRTANKVRVFVFAKDSAPHAESDAIATTDVYLDANGSFQMPEGVVGDGSYRIGVKPLNAPALARLYPGNITLSATAPSTTPLMDCPLGDLNGDGIVDEIDYNLMVQSIYSSVNDVNGDGFTDELDYNLIVQNIYLGSDFTP